MGKPYNDVGWPDGKNIPRKPIRNKPQKPKDDLDWLKEKIRKRKEMK